MRFRVCANTPGPFESPRSHLFVSGVGVDGRHFHLYQVAVFEPEAASKVGVDGDATLAPNAGMALLRHTEQFGKLLYKNVCR
jgi:hypothetical protein